MKFGLTRFIAQHREKQEIRLKFYRLCWSQSQLGHMLVNFLESSFEGRKVRIMMDWRGMKLYRIEKGR